MSGGSATRKFGRSGAPQDVAR